MARTFAAQRRISERILASPEHQAYVWALHKTADLPQHISLTNNEIEADWWALLRVAWKVKLGLDPRKPQMIGSTWVPV